MARLFDERDVRSAINDLMVAKLDPRNWDQYTTIEGAIYLLRQELAEAKVKHGQEEEAVRPPSVPVR